MQEVAFSGDMRRKAMDHEAEVAAMGGGADDARDGDDGDVEREGPCCLEESGEKT